MGYVVSRGGTFGVVTRRYRSDLTGAPMCVIKWGPLGWLTPVEEVDIYWLASPYEALARREALMWLAQLEKYAAEVRVYGRRSALRQRKKGRRLCEVEIRLPQQRADTEFWEPLADCVAVQSGGITPYRCYCRRAYGQRRRRGK